MKKNTVTYRDEMMGLRLRIENLETKDVYKRQVLAGDGQRGIAFTQNAAQILFGVLSELVGRQHIGVLGQLIQVAGAGHQTRSSQKGSADEKFAYY